MVRVPAEWRDNSSSRVSADWRDNSSSVAVSPNFDFSAIPTEDKLIVHDLRSNRVVAETELGWPLFVSDGVLITATKPGEIRLFRFEVNKATK
jgi:hypothetical protein